MRAALLILLTLAPAWAQPTPAQAAPAQSAKPAPPKRTFSFYGVVVDAYGAPVASAAVSRGYHDPGGAAVVTDSSGRFHLDNVPEGSVYLEVERTGFIPLSSYNILAADKKDDQRVLVTGPPPGGKPIPNDSNNPFPVTLVRQATVTGRVVNEDADPMRAVQVNLLQWTTMGDQRSLNRVASVFTDADGRYSLGSVKPGQYIVALLLSSINSPRKTLPEQYQTTFFPGVAGVSEAQQLDIATGAGLQLDDLIVRKVRMARVTIDVATQSTGALVYLAPKDGPLSSDITATPGILLEGQTWVASVPPGRYQLIASSGGGSIARDIDVGAEDTRVAVTVPAPAMVEGTVHLEGTVAVKAALTLKSKQLYNAPSPIQINPDEKGVFKIDSIPAGPWELVLRGTGADTYYGPAASNVFLRYVRMNGIDVMGQPLTFTGESTLEIGLAPTAEISGSVQVPGPGFRLVRSPTGGFVRVPDTSPRGVPATVVVWQRAAPEGQEPRYVALDTQSDGTFMLSGLPPGQYRILAFQLYGAGAPSYHVVESRAFRERYDSRADSLSVGEFGSVRANPPLVTPDQLQEVDKPTK